MLPTKSLIPNLRDLVKIGADFSATANVTISLETDPLRWEVSSRENSWVIVHREDGGYSTRRTASLRITGGAFAISVGYTSATADELDRPDGEEQ